MFIQPSAVCEDMLPNQTHDSQKSYYLTVVRNDQLNNWTRSKPGNMGQCMVNVQK